MLDGDAFDHVRVQVFTVGLRLDPHGESPLSRSSAGVLTHRRLAQCAVSVPLSLPQHPNQHRAKRLVLLAVDQELGERAALGVAPELSDPVGSLEGRAA